MRNRVLTGIGVISIACAVIAACSGDKGDTGPAGAAGAAGATGATGSTGSNGTNGTNGTNGSNGDGGANGGTVIVSATAKHGLDISPVPVNTAGMTGDQIELVGQGSYLVNAMGGCADCHNSQGATPKFLAGGTNFPLGGGNSVNARNLTPDTATGMKLTEAEFINAMRTGRDYASAGDAGADAGTRALIVMPWATYRWMSTHDLKAIYAYLRAIPAQNNAVAADVKPAVPPVPFPTDYNEGAQTRPLPPEADGQGNPIPDPNNVLRGIAINPLGVGAPNGASASAAFGRGSYIVNAVGGCGDCHTNPSRDPNTLAINVAQFLTGGGVFPTAVPAVMKTQRSMSANLIGQGNGVLNNGFNNFPVFLAALTQGVHADDPAPQAQLAFPMPWRVYRNMTADDLAAVYAYLSELAQNAGIIGPNDKVTQEAAKYCNATADCGNANETCDTTAHECLLTLPANAACNNDNECGTCQVCGVNNECELPANNSTCLSGGI